ncbi:MAG: hypothetical protein Q4B26_03170 [Eubacteriales bacterium]|nr:hypothetical protein [Eubacteriales bacterium]
MIVKLLDTKKTVEVNDSYGARLIEQGKAVLGKKKVEAASADAKPAKTKKADA